MSELKCPFCQQELEDANIHSSGLYFECPNCYGKQKNKDDNYTATPKVWQELIRTRKALGIAVDALKRANNTYCAEEEDITIDLTESAAHKWHRTAYQMEMPISIALEQITARE